MISAMAYVNANGGHSAGVHFDACQYAHGRFHRTSQSTDRSNTPSNDLGDMRPAETADESDIKRQAALSGPPVE
jgi:hypothetical protein